MKFKQVTKPYTLQPCKVQGLTNDLLILDNKYFVKQSKPENNAFLDLRNQKQVIKKIKKAKFTIPILEAKLSKDKLGSLMTYYPKLTTLTSKKINQETLKKLANLVQQLHQVKTRNSKIKRGNAIKQLNLYCSLIKPEKYNAEFEYIKIELTNWLKNYRPQQRVLAHNDLVMNNFVALGQKGYLIDGDFAMINDRLFDVASFVSETLTKQNDIEYGYQLFNLKESELKIVNNGIKYQNLIGYHGAMYLHQQTHDSAYKAIAKTKLANLFK